MRLHGLRSQQKTTVYGDDQYSRSIAVTSQVTEPNSRLEMDAGYVAGCCPRIPFRSMPPINVPKLPKAVMIQTC